MRRQIRQTTALLRRCPGVGCPPKLLGRSIGRTALAWQADFSIRLANSHDKTNVFSVDLGISCVRVLECGEHRRVHPGPRETLEVVFTLIDCISVGVDRMQRNFEPMRKQVEAWQGSELTDVTAKVVIYEAFIEGRLEAPKHLARSVHDLYFELRTEIRGSSAADDLESFERIHLRIQGTGAHPTIQGHGQAGRVPRSPILTVVLVHGAVRLLAAT